MIRPANSSREYSVIAEERLGVSLGKSSDLFSDEYVGERAKAIFELGQDLSKEAKEKEVFSVYETIDYPLFEILAEMERTGVFLNPRYLNDLEKKFSSEVNEIEKKIADLNRILGELRQFHQSCGCESSNNTECRLLECFENDWECCDTFNGRKK